MIIMKATIDPNLNAKEIVALRALNGWDSDESEWELCLKQNLLNISVRNENGVVIGVGFLCGNQRHAEIVDLVVHPDYRKQGIGREIVQLVVDYVIKQKIKYFGLTYDTNYPWLKSFYESEGFQQVGFAMWHTSSVKRLNHG